MANKKSKKSKTAKKKTRKGASGPRRPKTSGSHGSDMRLMRQVCSITDPFCKSAEGAKYPDASSMKTLAWRSEVFQTVNTDAQGRAALIFSPMPDNCYSTVATFGSGMTIATLNSWAPMPGWSNWLAGGVTWRVVSMGMELRSTNSAMNNQGSIGIACLPASTTEMIISPSTDLNATNFGANQRISANAGKQMVAISHSDGVVSKEFKLTSNPATNNACSYGNDVLIAYMVGGPASTASIEARLVINYELSFSKTSVFNQISTPAAVENTTVTTGANFVKRSIDQVIVGGSKELESRVMGAAHVFGRYAARTAMTAIGGYFGGPGGAAAGSAIGGMIMDVD